MTAKPYRARRKQARHSEQKEYPFYPNFFLRVLMAALGALAVITMLSALFPLPLDHMADPLAQPAPGTRALWILKPAILLSSILPGRSSLAMVLIAVLAALFVFLPLLDRSGHSSIRRRTLVAVPFLLWMLFLALSLMIPTGIPG